VAVASIVSTTTKLFDLTKAKKNYSKIASMAACAPSGVNQTTIAFGMAPPTYEDIASYNVPFPHKMSVYVAINDISKIGTKDWVNIANTWIAKMSECFLDIRMDVRLTQDYKPRTVLQPSNFLTWLWMHFLNKICETGELTNLKECPNCGSVYEGKAKLCPMCLKLHKNRLKKESRERLEEEKKAKEGR
jgi:hypothetical protein